MIGAGIYRGLVLRVFGSDAWEACRVKPAGFTISGAASRPSPRQVHSSDVRLDSIFDQPRLSENNLIFRQEECLVAGVEPCAALDMPGFR